MAIDKKSEVAICPNCKARVTVTFRDCEAPPEWEFDCPDCNFPLKMYLENRENPVDS